MASTRTVAAGGLVNFSSGLCRITTLVEKIDTAASANDRPIELYSSLVTIPDTGVSLPFDTVLGKTREINNIFDTSGAFAGSTSGNEIINDRTMTVTLANDFVFYSETPRDTAVLSNNILLRMLSADKFTLPGSDEIVYNIIGTNGSVKRDKFALTDQEFGRLFYQDGKLIIPNAIENNGDTKLQENTVITAFNKFNITVMIEFLYEFSATKKECYRYVYTIPGQIMLNEGDDYNKFTSEVQVLCDVRTSDKFFVDGLIENDYKWNVTSISSDLVTDTTSISVSATGEVEFGAGISIDIADYAVNEFVNVYTLDDGAGYAGYLAVKKIVGDTWLASPMLITEGGLQATAGTAATEFVVPIYDFDFIAQGFVQI